MKQNFKEASEGEKVSGTLQFWNSKKQGTQEIWVNY